MKLYTRILIAAALLLVLLTKILLSVEPISAGNSSVVLPDSAVYAKGLYGFPERVSAAVAVVGRDFASAAESPQTLGRITAAGADTLIIASSENGKNLLGSHKEAISSMCENAKAMQLAVYITLDISALLPANGTYAERIDTLCARVASAAESLSPDGFIVMNAADCSRKSQLDFPTGADSEAWSAQYGLVLAKHACSALRNSSNALIIGIEPPSSQNADELVGDYADFIYDTEENTDAYGSAPVLALETNAESPRSAAEYTLLDSGFFTKGAQNEAKAVPKLLAAGSVTPDLNTPVKQNDLIKVSVEALADSSVTAVFDGRTVTLSESDDAPVNSGYRVFSGSLPAGYACISARLYMRAVSGDIAMRLTGPLITVSRSGEIVIREQVADEPDKPREGSITHTEPLKLDMEMRSGTLVRIKQNGTLSYNPECSEKLVPTPDYPQLAEGMLDYLTGTSVITEREVDMCLLASGRSVKAESAELLGTGEITPSAIYAGRVYMDGSDTVIEFSQTTRTPYSISYRDFEYGKNIYGDWGDYFSKDFAPSALVIAFDYCSSAGGIFNFPEGALFDGCEWSEEAEKLCLTLSLRDSERFAGITVDYTEDGALRMRFNYLEHSLDGAVIVVDPGHGYLSAETYDPGAIGKFGSQEIYEADINHALSLLVTEKLEKRGATVIRFDTEKTPYDTFARSIIARGYSPDLFIAIHSDASLDSSAYGNSAYYFTPFSQPLAKSVSDSIASFFSEALYNGENRSKGDFYDYFAVTTQQAFPSVLVETGFITNKREASALIVPENQDKIAEAIVDGIESYFVG